MPSWSSLYWEKITPSSKARGLVLLLSDRRTSLPPRSNSCVSWQPTSSYGGSPVLRTPSLRLSSLGWSLSLSELVLTDSQLTPKFMKSLLSNTKIWSWSWYSSIYNIKFEFLIRHTRSSLACFLLTSIILSLPSPFLSHPQNMLVLLYCFVFSSPKIRNLSPCTWHSHSLNALLVPLSNSHLQIGWLLFRPVCSLDSIHTTSLQVYLYAIGLFPTYTGHGEATLGEVPIGNPWPP